jgi:ferredoxin
VHWLAYACWPAALAHSLGTGPGVRHGRLLDLAAACVLAAAGAVAWRLIGTLRGAPRAARGPGLTAVPEPIPAREPAPARARQLRVNPIACSGHGLCAELLPELIALDLWGYPLLADQPVPAQLARRATRGDRLPGPRASADRRRGG